MKWNLLILATVIVSAPLASAEVFKGGGLL
jgi:hypothetical protein